MKDEKSPGQQHTHLTYFRKLACIFAVNSGMRAAAKDASKQAPFASEKACALLGKKIMERAEMKILLQPKMDLRAKRVCGFEAFASPELDGERLPASVFVPSIDMAHLQRSFDWRVLSAGFSLAGQARVDSAAPISFNVSPVTLCERGFAEKLGNMARKHGVDLAGVKVEVLEKAPLNMAGWAQMKRQMEKARTLGFRFSIDDFGTGDANCSMLDLPAEELKIDAFYVRSLNTRLAQRWVASMLKLARDKGMSVCAEGVEHEWQVNILTVMGVDVGQGYLWAKSMEAAAALRLVNKAASATVLGCDVRLAAVGEKLDGRRARIVQCESNPMKPTSKRLF